jgi:hypothetical protein
MLYLRRIRLGCKVALTTPFRGTTRGGHPSRSGQGTVPEDRGREEECGGAAGRDSSAKGGSDGEAVNKPGSDATMFPNGKGGILNL